MQSIADKILARIYGYGRGWAFTQTDFLDLGSRSAIDTALHRLSKSGRIRRVSHGVYDYPPYSEFLKQTLSPDLDRVAWAIARKRNWRIEISGSTALNYLGLSTQVPGRLVYFSDGPNHVCQIGGSQIDFRHKALKEIGLRTREASLMVQALKAMGQERITSDVIDTLRDRLDGYSIRSILRDTKTVTGWVREALRDICREDIDGKNRQANPD